MHKLEIFDETFDRDRTESYELSIQVSLNGFSYAIKDISRNQFVALVSLPFASLTVSFDEWPEQIESIWNTFDWLKKPFHRVSFTYVSSTFLLVPSALFEPDRAKQLMELSNPIKELEEIRYNQLTEDTVSLFSIPSLLVSCWLKVHPKTLFLSFSHPTLREHLRYSGDGQSPTITISVAENFAVIVASKGKAIHHCGSLELATAADMVYHLLAICSSLNFDPSTTAIKIMGKCHLQWDILPLAAQYFQSVNLHNLTWLEPHFAYRIVRHKNCYANLFSQSLCV